MEVRSSHGAKASREENSLRSQLWGTQAVIDPVYIRKESGRKQPSGTKRLFFFRIFVVQIETPNTTRDPREKKTEKTNVKYKEP